MRCPPRVEMGAWGEEAGWGVSCSLVEVLRSFQSLVLGLISH